MTEPLDERLFDQLSTYQDVVFDGAVVRAGRRDCGERWRFIEPWLPAHGAVLDVGSNFGWFGLAACRDRPRMVVASVEADERSATVQRAVLASHRHERICLLTRRASPAMVRRFASAGQQFAAVFCLSVLHWIPRHREFLQGLEPLMGRFFIEHPDPREDSAGDSKLRAEIGDLQAYLRDVFPGRKATLLGETASHRDPRHPRPLWMVHEREGWSPAAPTLDVGALFDLASAWPPRSWWQAKWQESPASQPGGPCVGRLAPDGLQWTADATLGKTGRQWRRALERLPEDAVLTATERWRRRVRSWASGAARLIWRR